MIIRELSAGELKAATPRLAEILIDAVASGAGVSFMRPLSQVDAESFWTKQQSDIASGATTLFVNTEDDGLIVGCVLLIKAWAPNQPHRCDLAKMLVHRTHRRQGIATHLIRAAEHKARDLGLTLITFDAVTGGSADKLYRRLGYVASGTIPGYALNPFGMPDDTTIFYKQL
jgi:GNAT superfamily N-acetyltransferase